MSGEFHAIGGCGFFWKVLEDVDGDRPITGRPVTDAIRDLMLALAPIERAVAWEHEMDAYYVDEMAHEHRDAVKLATEKLNEALSAEAAAYKA